MSRDAMQQIRAADLQMSKDMGVPRHLYENSNDVIDWFGRFTVTINGRQFRMAITPSTLFVNESDPEAPIAQLTGFAWIRKLFVRSMFHADYVAPRVNGAFQIFRRADSKPFPGFEHIPHTHMLVYADGSNEKQFFPVTPEFSSK